MRLDPAAIVTYGPYRLRRGTPADREGILRTWHEVFRVLQPELRERSTAAWDWAFRDNPAGSDLWVAEADDGTIVAQYAGLAVRVHAFGQRVRFAQIVDSFTHEGHRAGLKRPGVFVATARTWIDAEAWPGRVDVAYGFPMPEPLRLGRRWIGYETVRTQLYLSLGVDHGVQGGAPAGLAVEELRHVPAGVEDLFTRCLRPDDVMAVRDAAWIAWRWLTHPTERYRLFVVRSGTGLRGLAVWRAGHFATLDQGLLVDWLVPDDDEEAARALLHFGVCASREAQLGRVGILLADTDPHWLLLQRLGMKVLWSPHTLIYGVWSRSPAFDDRSLRRHWRYTFGETDFA